MMGRNICFCGVIITKLSQLSLRIWNTEHTSWTSLELTQILCECCGCGDQVKKNFLFIPSSEFSASKADKK